MQTRFRPTIWHVVLVLPFLAIGIGIHRPIGDNSFLWHVTAGTVQLRQSAVLTEDPFSFTRLGDPWRTQSWLTELGYAVLDDAFGLAAVPWMVWGISALVLVGLWLAIYGRSRSLLATATTGVLSIVLLIAFLNPRPVLWSYLLFVLVVLADRDGGLRWALPPILWLWAAIHGSFVIGGVYLVLQAIRRRQWAAWRELLASGLLVTSTAHGIGAWQVLLDFGRSAGALDLISEWATPDLLTPIFAPLLIGILVLILGGIRGKILARDLWVIGPFLVLAFSSQRAVPPAWIALAPFVGVSLSGIGGPRDTPTQTLAIANAVLMVLAILAPLAFLPHGSLNDERFPIQAAEVLTRERVFHDDVTGGYLIYATGGSRLVFVDDRAELYGEDLLRATNRTLNGTPAWRPLFAEWDIEQALVRRGGGLEEALVLDGWRATYADENFAVLDR